MSRLHVISASTRPNSAGRPLARWVTDLAREHSEFDASLIDLGEVDLPFLDEPAHPSDRQYIHQHTKDWSATISAADAFIFVMPMYNGGFSAPLKNALDFLYQEWHGKPVGLISYSAGPSGGAPAIEMIQPVLGRLGLRPTGKTMSIPGINEHIGPSGHFEGSPALAAEAQTVLDAVAEMVATQQAA